MQSAFQKILQLFPTNGFKEFKLCFKLLDCLKFQKQKYELRF